MLDQALGQLDLELGDADAHQVDPTDGLGGGAVHVGIAVTEQWRPEGGVEVDVGPALPVGEPRPLGGGDHQLLQAWNTALAAVDATRDHGPRALGQLAGLGRHTSHWRPL